MMNGTEQNLDLRIWTYENEDISGYHVTWTTNENAMIVESSNDNAILRAIEEGIITVQATVNYYNESISASITIDGNPAPGRMMIDRDIVQELGKMVDYELEILTSSGGPYNGDYFITPEM